MTPPHLQTLTRASLATSVLMETLRLPTGLTLKRAGRGSGEKDPSPSRCVGSLSHLHSLLGCFLPLVGDNPDVLLLIE